jgi:hypothetical protein
MYTNATCLMYLKVSLKVQVIIDMYTNAACLMYLKVSLKV